MRTCLDEAERLSAGDISQSDFEGAKWVFLSGYILYRCPTLLSCLPAPLRHSSPLGLARNLFLAENKALCHHR